VTRLDAVICVGADDTLSPTSLNSSRSNTSTVFFHARSAIRSNPTPSFIRLRTHATPPTAHGSFLPLTAFPQTNFSGLVSGGKYSERSVCGSASMWGRDAWLAVIEHQGASVSNMIFPGGIALTAARLAAVFMEQPLTLIWNPMRTNSSTSSAVPVNEWTTPPLPPTALPPSSPKPSSRRILTRSAWAALEWRNRGRWYFFAKIS